MSELHEQLKATFIMYCKEIELLEDKKVKAAAPRARRALLELAKLIKDRRKEIQDIKSKI